MNIFVSISILTIKSHFLFLTAEFLISTRHRRDVGPVDDNILLMQSIQITDKFGFQPEDGTTTHGNDSGPHEKAYAGVAQDKLTCLNGYGKLDVPFRGLCEKAQSSANQS